MAYNQCDHQHISIIHYLQNQARPQDDEFIIVIEQLDHPELHRADGGRHRHIQHARHSAGTAHVPNR